MLRVFNVDQADSIELIPDEHCSFRYFSILVDCGNRSNNVFPELIENTIILTLSHSHSDHIGGLKHLFSKKSKINIKELWLPYYNDEIVQIANFILSLKGVSKSNRLNRGKKELDSIISAYNILNNSLKSKGCDKIVGLHEGKKICKHFMIFNPPLEPDTAHILPEGTCNSYWKYQQETRYELIENWLDKEKFNQMENYFISEGKDPNIPNFIDEEELSWNMRMQFIYGFFYKYESLIDYFIDTQDVWYFDKLIEGLKLTSNDISIVFRYSSNPKNEIMREDISCLLTGDIGNTQLRRCLFHNYPTHFPKVEILKFPHHGSRMSLDKFILRHLSPEIVIVSHGNRRFGNSKDPHPNIEVIDVLDKMNINVAYTNDVIKNGLVIKKKSNPYPHRYVEMVDLS